MGVMGVNDFVQQVIQGGILLFALFVEFLQKRVVMSDKPQEVNALKAPV